MEKNSVKQRRQFYLILFLALGTVAGFKWYGGKPWLALSLGLAGVMPFIIEFGLPRVSEKIFSLWMKFAQVLATINTHILVTVIYFLILTPVGVFRRLAGKYGRYEVDARRKKSSWLPIVEARSMGDRYTSPF